MNPEVSEKKPISTLELFTDDNNDPTATFKEQRSESASPPRARDRLRHRRNRLTARMLESTL